MLQVVKNGLLKVPTMSVIDKKVRKKRRWGKVFEYNSYERLLPVGKEYEDILNELVKEYSKKKSILVTPQEIAAKRDIRVSVAKHLLDDLTEKKILKQEHSFKRLKIYTRA